MWGLGAEGFDCRVWALGLYIWVYSRDSRSEDTEWVNEGVCNGLHSHSTHSVLLSHMPASEARGSFKYATLDPK